MDRLVQLSSERVRHHFGRRLPKLRRLVREVIPTSRPVRRIQWRLSPLYRPTRTYLLRHGRTVLAGPFAGVRYPTGDDWGIRDLVAKLSGSYELELHSTLETVIAAGPTLIVDVGSAEGYYAVGLARRLPAARVLAYDIDAGQRTILASFAGLNGVADRITILEEFPGSGWCGADETTFVLFDCEGAEWDLVDPIRQPGLRRATIVVELHEFFHESVLDELTRRCRTTHAPEIIPQTERQLQSHPAVAGLNEIAERRRAILLDERRPTRMRWLVLRPLSAS